MAILAEPFHGECRNLEYCLMEVLKAHDLYDLNE